MILLIHKKFNLTGPVFKKNIFIQNIDSFLQIFSLSFTHICIKTQETDWNISWNHVLLHKHRTRFISSGSGHLVKKTSFSWLLHFSASDWSIIHASLLQIFHCELSCWLVLSFLFCCCQPSLIYSLLISLQGIIIRSPHSITWINLIQIYFIFFSNDGIIH